MSQWRVCDGGNGNLAVALRQQGAMPATLTVRGGRKKVQKSRGVSDNTARVQPEHDVELLCGNLGMDNDRLPREHAQICNVRREPCPVDCVQTGPWVQVSQRPSFGLLQSASLFAPPTLRRGLSWSL